MSQNPLKSSHNVEGKQLPATLTVSKFAAARGKEIEIMKKALSAKSGTKLAFQKLPKHMRRRAMSHNVKRLPRRLRQIHLNQMKKSGFPPKQKRPSRKYRRRPYNLISDYMRRQRKHKWLNTHIWHAKRFHMIEKWGYKLPDRPCDKSFRACYRASVHHCLLQDISYYSCIEIIGDRDIIINNFKKITNPATGLTIGAKPFLKGYREGSVTIFENSELKKAVGIVYFNWKPSQVNNKHALWIWIHASYYSEILEILISSFNLKLNSMETESFNEALSYVSCDDIQLRELKLELNRFRLTGPLSNSIIQNCFHIIEDSPGSFKSYYRNANNEDQLPLQRKYWKNLKNISSAAELPPHMILSVIILDPRFHLPKTRTKAIPEITNSSNCIDMLPEMCADGPIWDSTIRKTVKESKISNAQLAEMRSKLLVPGSDMEEKGVPIPIMLIQRPGMKRGKSTGYGSGWDIIIPSDWAQPIWMSLIMWGARVGGLRESNSIAFHMDQQILYPDTTAGKQEENFISDKCKEIFFKLPPNKRTNYNKFRIASPMEWSWNLLLSDWNDLTQDSVEDFFVLRNRQILRNIRELLFSTSKQAELPICSYNCLLPVSIEVSNKGLCKQFAIICLPKENDVTKNPTEEICVDKNEKLRKEIRKNHKDLLKKLRRRRVRSKKKGKAIPIDKDILKNYSSKMRKLWFPEPTTIRHSCSREVIGFIRHGDFNFLSGQSKGIGYIAFSALRALMALKNKNKVLIRNPNSRQYRFGTLEILDE